MRVVFAGTPEFASNALLAILEAGFEVPLVFTQPDRRAGRGMRQIQSAVKQLALQHDIPVSQPRSLRLDGKTPEDAKAAQAQLVSTQADVMVVAAYGLLLPTWVLELPRYGCLNIHASLLPRWRGAAPIQRAIEAGDTRTGISIMQMDEGLDTGAVLLQKPIPIRDDHTAASLHDELATAGAAAIVEALQRLPEETLVATPQASEGVTYAEKLTRKEAPLDFNLPASVLARRVRAFNPFPGTTMSLKGLDDPVKVWQAVPLPLHQAEVSVPREGLAPGTILQASAQGIDVMCGEGILRILELQRAGARRQPVATFIQGWAF